MKRLASSPKTRNDSNTKPSLRFDRKNPTLRHVASNAALTLDKQAQAAHNINAYAHSQDTHYAQDFTQIPTTQRYSHTAPSTQYFSNDRWQNPPQNSGNNNAPAPAKTPATNCSNAFTGHSFALANQTASGASPSAAAKNISVGQKPFVQLMGIAPANYQPKITPTGTKSADYEVGLIQNVLTGTRNAIYDVGTTISTQPATLPIKDGAPSSSGIYDVDFAENGKGHKGVLEPFTASGSQVALKLPDTPGGGAFLQLYDDNTSNCPLVYRDTRLSRLRYNDTFRTWVGVRHKPTKCVKTIHHIDWETDWDLKVSKAKTPTLTFTTNKITVSVTNGNGSPAYIRGGKVPADGITKSCQ